MQGKLQANGYGKRAHTLLLPDEQRQSPPCLPSGLVPVGHRALLCLRNISHANQPVSASGAHRQGSLRCTKQGRVRCGPEVINGMPVTSSDYGSVRLFRVAFRSLQVKPGTSRPCLRLQGDIIYGVLRSSLAIARARAAGHPRTRPREQHFEDHETERRLCVSQHPTRVPSWLGTPQEHASAEGWHAVACAQTSGPKHGGRESIVPTTDNTAGLVGDDASDGPGLPAVPFQHL